LSLDKTRSVQRRYLEKALTRCSPGTVHNFLTTLERLNDLERQKIEAIVSDKIASEWIETLSAAIRESSEYQVKKGDGAVFKVACSNKQIALFLNSTVESYRLKQFSLKK
jgi:succinylglutamate desuccinylase